MSNTNENGGAPTPEQLKKAEAAAADQAAAEAKEKAGADAAAKLAAKGKGTKGKKDEPEAVEDGKVTVTVIGPANGRRRAGFSFGPNPSVVNVTEEQLALLKGDASLSVSEGKLHEGATQELEARGGVHTFTERLPIEAYKGEITVIGPSLGRRRAGRTFGKEPVTFKPTKAELEAILADEMLSVSPA